jgi:hypothetical protein
MCNCCNCASRRVKTTAVEVNGSALTLTVAPGAFSLPGEYELIICTPIPAVPAGTNPTVEVTDGTHIYPCYTRVGNNCRADNINCVRCWPVYYGNDPEHITVLCGVNLRAPMPGSGDGYVPA